MGQTLIVKSTSHNPWHNLALEEYLMTKMPDSGSGVLFLWQNQNTVVIGRNQNAWLECKTALLEREGGQLARRTTGGGAVFHDLGNLNFSLILPEADFDLDVTFDIVLSAVNSFGVNAKRSGRNDILIDGRKFSGNAFRLANGFGLHHGTLLVNSEFERVGRYLTVAPAKLAAKGIQSVRSRITNLAAVKSDITINEMEHALTAAFLAYRQEAISHDSGAVYLSDTDFASSEFTETERKFSSWAWRYGESLVFDLNIEQRFDWGLTRIGLKVGEGIVTDAAVYSDALDSDLIRSLPDLIIGCRFHSLDICRAIRSCSLSHAGFITSRSSMIEQLCNWIMEQGW